MSVLLMVITIATARSAPAPAAAKGFISGKVLLMREGKPVSGAVVSLFNVDTGPAPDQSGIRRVPEGFTRVARTGFFKKSLFPGRYYLGVLFRADPKIKGPPGPDEFFFFPRDDEGKLRQFEVVAGLTTETGDLGVAESEIFPEITNAFVVEGTISDEQGKPFGGVLILVRRNIDSPRPLFISQRTGLDGRYQLKLPPGQKYYLVARENLVDVGRPKPGYFIGTYGGSKPQLGQVSSVFSGSKTVFGVANQVTKGIDITMYKIPDPEELKKKILEDSKKLTTTGSTTPMTPGN